MLFLNGTIRSSPNTEGDTNIQELYKESWDPIWTSLEKDGREGGKEGGRR